MPGKISVRYDLPVDVETAYAAISGNDWAPTKARELGDDSTQVSRTEGPAGAVTLVVTRKLPDGVPGFLTQFLPADGRVIQTDTWGAADDGVRAGTWKADTVGSPAKVAGVMRLEPAGSGCVYVVEGSVKVSIPLIGGKAENLVVRMTEKLTSKEADVLRAMLS
ncbi:MAG: hypothetical protein JWM02_1959 [Frankiales bacterium]|nr:hypothetical protein [Frankiales bacterium]